MIKFKKVDALRFGDRFLWAGRPVELVDEKPLTLRGRNRRPARCLIVEEANGELHQLHYYCFEKVQLANNERESI